MYGQEAHSINGDVSWGGRRPLCRGGLQEPDREYACILLGELDAQNLEPTE